MIAVFSPPSHLLFTHKERKTRKFEIARIGRMINNEKGKLKIRNDQAKSLLFSELPFSLQMPISVGKGVIEFGRLKYAFLARLSMRASLYKYRFY
jgi:hypothetical protein